jgi:thiamine biosynthesis protein ThiS
VGSNDYFQRVHVIINGEPRELHREVTVAALVGELGLSQRRIAVEINREIVARDAYSMRILTDGDQIEIVHFVGGG